MPKIGWLEAQQAVDEWDRQEGSRRAEHVEFVLGIPESAYEWTPGTSESDVVTRAAEREAAAVAGIAAQLGGPSKLRWHPTGVGRGAEGDAVGIIIDLGTVTGGIVAFVEGARLTARLWRRLRTRRPRPTLSLGAVKILCVADLATKVPPGELEDIAVVAAADVGPQRSSELGHTGADLFTVVFASTSRTYIYVVDAEGGLVHFGYGNQLSAAVALFSGLPTPDWEAHPPSLLADDDEREPPTQ